MSEPGYHVFSNLFTAGLVIKRLEIIPINHFSSNWHEMSEPGYHVFRNLFTAGLVIKRLVSGHHYFSKICNRSSRMR